MESYLDDIIKVVAGLAGAAAVLIVLVAWAIKAGRKKRMRGPDG